MDSQYRKPIISGTIELGLRLIQSIKPTMFARINVRRMIAVLCLCTMFSIGAANINFAYAVSMNGHILCYAFDRAELDGIITDVEKTASEALGFDFSFDSDLSTRLSIGNDVTVSAQKLKNLLLSSIPEIKYLYVISLDGKAICALNDRQTAENVIRRLLSEYINDNTLSASFLGSVEIEGRYARSLLLSDPDLAYLSLLSSVKVQTLESKTVEEPISYEVDTVDDASLLSGETVVKSEGINGKALVDYKVSYVNGVETDKAIENITVVSEPVNAVVLRGTKERLSTGSYIWPTEGEITSDFGYRNVSVGSRNHKGIDIASDYGTPVYAADGGEVIMAEYYYGYGRFVKIKHDNGDITYYAHLSCINVSVGDKVGQGDMIGEMGCSGTATGTHLHFEYHPDGGDAADPITILPAR